MIYINIF